KRIRAYSSLHPENKSDDVVTVYAPLNSEALYWSARDYIQLGQYDDARKLLTDLSDPPSRQPYWLMPAIYLSLAQIEYHAANVDEGDRLLEQVLTWKDLKDSHDKARLLKKKKERVGTFDLDFQ